MTGRSLLAGTRSLWLRASGLAVVLSAIWMPYGLRLRWAYLLNFVFNRPSESAALLLRGPSTLLNRALLVLIYVFGVGGSRLLFLLGPRSRPEDEAGTFWVERPEPEEYSRDMELPY